MKNWMPVALLGTFLAASPVAAQSPAPELNIHFIDVA